MPKGDDGQRLERRGEAGDGRHRAFDADVVGARHAAANADAASGARHAVIGRAARDGVHQIFAAQRLDRRQAFGRQPPIERGEKPLADQRGIEDAAVEQHVRGRGDSAGSAADGAVFHAGRLLAQEARHVARDRGVGRIGQAEFLHADAALHGGHLGARHGGQETLAEHLFDVAGAAGSP